MIETQFNTKTQVFKNDNGKEYFHTILGKYFNKNGIVHQSFRFDTPQQNGVAEKKNHRFLEVARSIMFTSNVPKHFWGNAILTTTYLINRMPFRVLNFKSSCEVLLSNFSYIGFISSLLKVFACTAFVHIYPHQRSKLDPKATKCIFLGYFPKQIINTTPLSLGSFITLWT